MTDVPAPCSFCKLPVLYGHECAEVSAGLRGDLERRQLLLCEKCWAALSFMLDAGQRCAIVTYPHEDADQLGMPRSMTLGSERLFTAFGRIGENGVVKMTTITVQGERNEYTVSTENGHFTQIDPTTGLHRKEKD